MSFDESGSFPNVEMPSYKHRNSHVKNQTVSRPSYLCDVNPYVCIETATLTLHCDVGCPQTRHMVRILSCFGTDHSMHVIEHYHLRGREWVSNYIHGFLWNAITHPCRTSATRLSKHSLQLGDEWVITSHWFVWCDYLSIYLGLYSLRRRHLSGIGIPIINLRRSDDRLRFIMGIPILIRRRLLSE